MMTRNTIIFILAGVAGAMGLPVWPAAAAGGSEAGVADRAYQVKVLTRISRPVLEALSENKLKARMPVREWEKGRAQFAALEVTGRTLSGLAPWLALGADESPEGRLRAEFIEMSRKCVINITDPKGPDFGNFNKDGQPLVDAAYLSYAFLRAPKQLWDPLTESQRSNVVAALESTRIIRPGQNNWLLFSAMVEAGLWELTGSAKMKPMETAVNTHMEWYKGDGTYGDGPNYHWDYYNSYVIQPFLQEVLGVCKRKGYPLASLQPQVIARARRYAEVQERLISPEGTYPLVGRSSVYRFAAFHHLAYMTLTHQLPASLNPGAVRSGLTAVVRRMIEAPGTFDEKGWLNLGAVGHQESMRDSYNNTGSLYICLDGLIALGLPPDDPYWAAPAAPWTQKRIWAGEDVAKDRGLK
jgi:hypothetical protein